MKDLKVEMKNISIEFPGVKALTNADFSLEGGEIHALIGSNGAGKSTLMKVLAGANSHYTGEIYIDGVPVEIRSPKDAKKLGIEIVYQEVDTALIPYLSVAENVMFNYIVNEMGHKQKVDWKYIKSTAKQIMNKLNVEIDINRNASELTLAEKQMVLIARSVVEDCRLLILDEPTAPLSNSETEELFRIVRELKAEGVGIIFISHRLNELFEICETITIMRDGKIVTSKPITKDLKISEVVELMLGKVINEKYIKRACELGDILLEVKNLTEKEEKVKNLSFNVRKGEVIGIAGLVGAGKTELCKTLFSEYKRKSGEVILHGQSLKYNTPAQAVAQGFALVPEERRKEGVLITDPVFSNITVASMQKYTGLFSFVNVLKEKRDAKRFAEDIGIVTPSIMQKVALLSGGNQQKVVISKWLNSDAEVYILDEPTKGIDVGAKEDMYKLIEKLADEGKGIIYASCEYNEILSIADRIYVMYDGEIVRELDVKDATEKELLYYSTGGN